MGVLAFIPARGGSVGIKDKNITLLCGKPLIYWVLQALVNSENVDKIIVATDSEKIENVVNNLGFSKVEIYRRNPQNAQDKSPTIDVVLEYIDYAHLSDEENFLLIQATSPLLTNKDVEGFLKQFFENLDKDSSFSAVELKRIFYNKDGIPINHDLKDRKQRYDIDGLVVENGAMYINSVKNIKAEKAILSGKILPYLMPNDTLREIDEYEDINFVEELLKKKNRPDIKNFDLLIIDCDGVLTDGGMYYSKDGEALKKFNTTDGFAINEAKKANLKVAIVTGENTEFALKRAEKLNIECYLGISDKLSCVKNIADKYNTDLSRVIYIGDDLNDLEVIKNVGFSACPVNAQQQIKNNVNFISRNFGGNGAVREIVNYLLDV